MPAPGCYVLVFTSLGFYPGQSAVLSERLPGVQQAMTDICQGVDVPSPADKLQL